MLDKNKFGLLVSTVSAGLQRDALFIEKDYYQTLMLQKIAGISEKLVFKGGTSLSKCYKMINRFSEDIDISAVCKLTEGERRRIYHAIIDAAKEVGLSFPDESKTKSKQLYNKFVFEYQSVVNGALLPLIIETNYDVPVYPVEEIEIPNFIEEFFLKQGVLLPEELGIRPLRMKVQKPVRTMIDKIFALCDYLLKGEQTGHSRHLYDVHILFEKIEIDDEFVSLCSKVRKERSGSKMNPSAMPDVDLQELFGTVMDDKTYKRDYKDVTEQLIYDKCSYETVIETMKKIRENGFLKNI